MITSVRRTDHKHAGWVIKELWAGLVSSLFSFCLADLTFSSLCRQTLRKRRTRRNSAVSSFPFFFFFFHGIEGWPSLSLVSFLYQANLHAKEKGKRERKRLDPDIFY